MVDFVSQYILTILVAVPLLGAALLFMLPKGNVKNIRHVALGVTLVEFVLSLHLIAYFVPTSALFQFGQISEWLPTNTGIKYIVGVDGISLILVMLTTALCPLVMLSTYSSVEDKVREFCALFLFLEAAMVGTFFALDLVLFYVFWEAMLIPMYFLIGIWGGKDRIYATTKFVIYTVIGSLLMLVSFSYLYFVHARMNGGVYSTSLIDIYKTAAMLPLDTQLWLFAASTLAFAIKVPLFPFHTWLPDAHVQAPTAGSVILAGVLLKMGTYGLLRFSIPMFPQAAHAAAPLMITLGVIGIIYGALIAWRQTDVKKLIAYSSVSHLGFVVAGLFALNEMGITGALYQMVNHGVSTGALFLLVGVLYERRHTREMKDFSGLAKSMPWFAFFLVVATLASVGLPGTGGFIGEWLILLGTFNANKTLGILAATGVILGAIYMLWLVLKVIWGPLDKTENREISDVNPREAFILSVLSVLVFVMGFGSAAILEHTQATLVKLQKSVAENRPYETELVVYKADNVTRQVGHTQAGE